MEMVRDPTLLRAIRNEVTSVESAADPATGQRTFNLDRLTTLPLLQSFYTELMRLRVSINVTREVVQPLEVEGYMLPPGSVMQAPTELAHCDEAVWGAEGHPAKEFWASRHIRYEDAVDEMGNPTGERTPVFAIKGRPADFFPYGKLHPVISTKS
jgi:hypothetical protein